MKKQNNSTFFLVLLLIISIFGNIYLLSNKKNIQDFKPNSGQEKIEQTKESDKNISSTSSEIKNEEKEKNLSLENKINFFEEKYNKLLKAESDKEISAWLVNDYDDTFMGALLRLKDQKTYDKIFKYSSENYVFASDNSYLKKFKKDFEINTKEDYVNYFSNFYNKVTQGKVSELSEKDKGYDFYLYYSDMPLEKALDGCNELRAKGILQGDYHSCEDKIYAYRATKENKYCEKIKDFYKKNSCEGFLEYIEKNK